jgi:hypothetical protein
MRDLVLFQGLSSEYGSRQWLETMEMIVTTYYAIVLSTVGFIVICAIFLAVLEWRQKGKQASAPRVRRPYAPKRQPLDTARFESLMREHPSLF